MRDKVLFADDFKGFRIGEFPYDRDHSAAGEYHYVVEEGAHGAWTDQVCNYRYNGHGPSWIITEDHGKHFMEQCRIEKGLPHRIFPTLQTGTVFWRDYDVEVTMRRISTKGMAGLAFCMNNSLDTLVFSLEGRERARLAWRHKEEVKVLAEAAVLSGPDSYYRLKVSVDGEQIQCFVDGVQVFSVRDARAAKGGKIGLTADCPTQFADVRVSVDRGTGHAMREQEERERQRIHRLQASYPGMKLWRKIDLRDFGASRQIRFGHLMGTEEWQIVIPQAQKRVDRDSYGHISCLTAIDLFGNVLWQRGEPSENAPVLGKISADLPGVRYRRGWL